jgi:hypothetical protein
MSRRVRAMAASLRSGRSESSWRERGIASGVRGVMRILSGISRRWFAGLRRREWPRRSRSPRNANTGRLGTSRSGEPGAPWMVRDNSGSTERRGHGPMWSHRGRAWQAPLWDRHNTTVEVGQSVGLHSFGLARIGRFFVERAPDAAAHFTAPILHAFEASAHLMGRTCVDLLYLEQMGGRGSA